MADSQFGPSRATGGVQRLYSDGQETFVPTETRNATNTTVYKGEDRVAKINDKIQKLNIQLMEFQSEIEEQKNDPILKSTQRSNASNTKLANNISQKSGQTAQTVPAGHPKIPNIKDARLFANLSSAPGTNRIKLKGINQTGTQPNIYEGTPLGITSQCMPTPNSTASIQDGQTRVMNSAQGKRKERSNGLKESVTTHPGANDERI